MPTLQQQIVKKFLAKLSESGQLDAGKLEQLEKLLGESKAPKADDFVKVFSQPTGGGVK